MRAPDVCDAIRERLGFVPPFFQPAVSSPQVLAELWQHTLSAYLENPIPDLLKEKLFAYLSRFCSVPYCVICHSCALRPRGYSSKQILELLETPSPDDRKLSEALASLESQRIPWEHWPASGSQAESDLFCCAVSCFLAPQTTTRIRPPAVRLLGEQRWNHLLAFLLYVHTCHRWLEFHPELSAQSDKRAQEHLSELLADEPALGTFFETYSNTVAREQEKRETDLRDELAERKRVEDELRDAEQELAQRLRELEHLHVKHAALVDAVEGIVWEGDPATLRFTFVSRQAERLLGYPLEQWLMDAEFWLKHMHPGDRDWAPAYCAEATQAGRSHEFEYRMLAADGRVVWLRDIVSVTIENGQVVKSQGIMVDITKRKEAETRVKQLNAELNERIRELEQFTECVVGRELKMIELEKELAALRGRQNMKT